MEKLLTEALSLGAECPESVYEELRKVPLGEVTNGLGVYLCKEATVEAAMQTLARSTIRRDSCNSVALKTVCCFFAEKLQYTRLLAPALSCLAMIATDAFSQAAPCNLDTFLALGTSPFWAVKAQSLPLPSRRHYYDVLGFVVNGETAGELDSKQLRSILSAVDGESDPQLVLRAFRIHFVVASRVSPAVFAGEAQDYFESLSSYFPIVFARPPGCVVTKKDLRDALAAAMKLEVYKDYCVPFLFGKLASPSFSVKDDALDVLCGCMTVYNESAFREFAPEVVIQMRNEVLKLAAYGSYEGNNPTLSNQIEACCTIMRVVSRRYSESGSAKGELLKVFEPVTEGLIACSTSRESQTCASYATMMFHILTGAWPSCLHVGSYVLTMLALNAHDAVSSQAALLVSGVCSGIIDALALCQERDCAKEQLRGALAPTLPMLTACGKQAAEALCANPQCPLDEEGSVSTGGVPSSTPPASAADDGAVLSLLCLAECVAAIIKLSTTLDPLIAHEDIVYLARCLVDAAQAHDSRIAGAQMTKLFSTCLALPNSTPCLAVLKDTVTQRHGSSAGHSRPSSTTTLQFLRRVGDASPEAAEIVLVHGLLCVEWLWASEGTVVNPAEVAEAALSILTGPNGPQNDDAVAHLLHLPKLTTDAAFFECACYVYSRASRAFCEKRVERLLKDVPLLEAAALVSSRVDVEVPPNVAQAVAQALLAECTPKGTAFVLATLNGLTAFVRGGADLKLPNSCDVTPQQLDVAVLWGKLLRGSDLPSASEVPSLCFVSTCDKLASREEERTLTALGFFPCLASLLPNRARGLLGWLVEVVGRDAAPSPLFWQSLAVVLGHEVPTVVEHVLPALVSLCEQAAGRVDDMLLSCVMMKAARQTGNSTYLAHIILSHRPLRCAVLSGARSADLQTRCDCLNYLGSLAGVTTDAATPGGGVNEVTKEDAKEARTDILQAAQHALNDHKRLVRQAAAKCRQEWFKSRLP